MEGRRKADFVTARLALIGTGGRREKGQCASSIMRQVVELYSVIILSTMAYTTGGEGVSKLINKLK